MSDYSTILILIILIIFIVYLIYVSYISYAQVEMNDTEVEMNDTEVKINDQDKVRFEPMRSDYFPLAGAVLCLGKRGSKYDVRCIELKNGHYISPKYYNKLSWYSEGDTVVVNSSNDSVDASVALSRTRDTTFECWPTFTFDECSTVDDIHFIQLSSQLGSMTEFEYSLDPMITVNIEEIYNNGMKAYEAGNNEQAIEHFQQIMAFDKSPSKYYLYARHNIGCNLISMGRELEGAMVLRSSALADHPDSLYYYGRYLEKHNDIHAINCFIRATLLGNTRAYDALERLELTHELRGKTLEDPLRF